MSDYQLSKIYCIRGGDEVYIGSTIQKTSSRFTDHKRHYKLFKAGKYGYTSSFILLDKYGVENCTIEVLEVYPCNSLTELRKKEGEYITTTNCVNKRIAGRTIEEYNKEHKEQKKEYNKEYREKHKEQIKDYREEHKEQSKEYKKEYREKHKEQIKEKNKKYREEHKEQIKEKLKKRFTCECGSELTIHGKVKHEKSKKHLKFVSKII